MIVDGESWLRHPVSGQFPPIYYDFNPVSGQYQFPGDPSIDAVPEGYERKQITSFREYEKFRRDWEAVESEEVQGRIQAEKEYFDNRTKERRERIREELSRRGMNSRMFDLVQQYVDRRREARYRRLKAGSPNCHVRILEFGPSEQSIVK